MPSAPETLYNIVAEFQLLGCLLVDNSLASRMPFLEEPHFWSPPHRRIFRAILTCVEQGKSASPLTLRMQFEEDDDLIQEGGAKYLVQMVGESGHVIDPIDHARYLVELAQRRMLLSVCEESSRILSSESSLTPSESALELMRKCEDIMRGFDSSMFIDDQRVADRILKDMAENKAAISTGIPKLDEAMGGGIYPGKAYGFAARKKVGKTILAGTISYNLAEQGIKHLFLCTEMGPYEIHQRNLARACGFFPSVFRSDSAKSLPVQRKIADVAAQSKRLILYQNAPSLSFERLKRIVIAAVVQRKVSGIILDYWQLVGGKPNGKSTSEHLDEVAQWIADSCRKYEIWAIVMAQINQEGNTRGGEGIRLAFDQVYQLNPLKDDIGKPERWLEMLDTRYTKWLNIGGDDQPGLYLNDKGPYFEQA